MATLEKTTVTVEATINAPVEKVWALWTEPKHIVNWNFASDDWHSPSAENDLQVGGKFTSRMEAKDGSFGFDFGGIYNEIVIHQKIVYTMDDERRVEITFNTDENTTIVTETFDAETSNDIEMQRAGWQAILNNFKKYVERSDKMERLHFEISIQAPVEKVYHIMLDKTSFKKWCSAFNEGSFYKGSWEKGSKILFLGTDPNGDTSGMVSTIRENIPNQFVSIEHLGVVHNNEEITSGETVEGWAGALENYTFSAHNGTTLLTVDLDVNQEYKSYFEETWPKALEILKSICEK